MDTMIILSVWKHRVERLHKDKIYYTLNKDNFEIVDLGCFLRHIKSDRVPSLGVMRYI